MAGKMPTAGKLDKPERYDELLKEDGSDDCLSCRVMGGGAFLGLAAYSYYTGARNLEKQRAKILLSKSAFGPQSRHLGIVVTSLGLAGLGFWRLVA